MITLPDGKICNNLPEQVAKNAKDILEVAAQWQPYKEELEADFETLADYLADMSSAAVGAIAGQDIAPANVSATTSISAPSVTGDSIIENMSGYSYADLSHPNITVNYIYAGVAKTGNKLTVVLAFNATPTTIDSTLTSIGRFILPAAVLANLYTTTIAGYGDALSVGEISFYQYINNPKNIPFLVQKGSTGITINIYNSSVWSANTTYYGRLELTFLLGDNLAP